MADPLRGSPQGPTGPGPVTQGMPGEFRTKEPTVEGESFLDFMKKSINEVNNMQAGAASKVQKLVTGEIKSLHEVMVATEEAGIAFNLTMQIRNKLIQAWDELKRMPV